MTTLYFRNWTDGPPSKEKLAATHGASVDGVLKSLAYGGTLSLVGGLTGYDGQIPAIELLLRTARAQGIYVGSRADYQRMAEFIGQRAFQPAIDRVFPLEECEAALAHMESGDFVGKIVLKL